MKKLFLVFTLTVLVISCSKKVEIKGKINNVSPLDRIEIIDYSGIINLPLLNIGINEKGEFSGSLEIPKNGMYAISFHNEIAFIYIERGQTIHISSDAFPSITITGDAKANNDFIKIFDDEYRSITSKIDVSSIIEKTENEFIKEIRNIYSNLEKILEKNAKNFGASENVIKYKKDDLQIAIAGLVNAYKQYHTNINPKFTPSKNLKNLSNEFLINKDRKIKTLPIYRTFLLNGISSDFNTFALKEKGSIIEAFTKFLKTQTELTQTEKDYLYGNVLAQTQINPDSIANYDKVSQWINNISNKEVKQNLKTLQTALMGQKTGVSPHLNLKSVEGKRVQLADFKEKPTLLTFHASWNPSITSAFSSLKEIMNLYKDKVQFIYINLDDTKEQFEKTNQLTLKELGEKSYWVEGGINAEQVKKMGVYSFRIPSYIILDKNGKIYDRPFFHIDDPDFIKIMNKLTKTTYTVKDFQPK